ncbi:MAG: phosphoribosyltransferase family protein, partial [Bacteroidota bacterium]
YLQAETKRIQEQLKSRYALFRGNKSPVPLTGKTVIITDDGIATGRTILAALPAIQKKHPAEIVIATPVCSLQARARLEPLVDQLISCADPDPFIGVGRFYNNFEEITDLQVLSLLQSLKENTPHAPKN